MCVYVYGECGLIVFVLALIVYLDVGSICIKPVVAAMTVIIRFIFYNMFYVLQYFVSMSNCTILVMDNNTNKWYLV